MQQRYYKFRCLQNLKHFIDIILNKRLYAPRYDELNDPMEGVYLIDPSNSNVIRLLKEEKYRTRICSVSKDYKHTLLWAHYADGHKGCCIEVSVPSERGVPEGINYVNDLPIINDLREGKDLLIHKSTVWEYEKEVRFFSKNQFLNVKVHRVIFGKKITKEDFKFYKKLIQSIDPNIDIRIISENELETGFR